MYLILLSTVSFNFKILKLQQFLNKFYIHPWSGLLCNIFIGRFYILSITIICIVYILSVFLFASTCFLSTRIKRQSGFLLELILTHLTILNYTGLYRYFVIHVAITLLNYYSHLVYFIVLKYW